MHLAGADVEVDARRSARTPGYCFVEAADLEDAEPARSAHGVTSTATAGTSTQRSSRAEASTAS